MASELAYEASDEASENELLDKSLSVWKGWNPACVIDNEDFSPVRIDIHTASSIGQYESVRSLINKGGIDVDRRNKGGWTPLMYASYIGHEAIAKLLIDAECDINMKNNKGHTPLMLAACCGNEAVGHLLVKHEAELEAMDKKGWTALFHATNSGHQNFVRFLLASGANMDAVVPSSGITPLMEAAAEGHEIIVQLFLQFGVNVNAKTYNGDMARSVALIHGYMKIVSLIDNHLMPLSIRAEPKDFSSSDEAVRRPRPQNLRGGKLKLKSGPSIRDGPDAIARLIDRTKTVSNQHLTADVCVPKGYVTFPQNSGDQSTETQLSYRDVTSPINPEDYTLDSSGESYENEEDSNAFSKTGAITIKSSSSSSGGLVAALGLSRDNSLESDDFTPPHHHHHSQTTNPDTTPPCHHSDTAFTSVSVPITTLTPSSSCDEEVPPINVSEADRPTFKTPKTQTFGQWEGISSKTQHIGDPSGQSSGVRGRPADPKGRLSAADSQLETNYRNLVSVLDNQLNSGATKHLDTRYSHDGRDSGISTNDAEEFNPSPAYFHPGVMSSPGEVNHGTTVNKQSSVISQGDVTRGTTVKQSSVISQGEVTHSTKVKLSDVLSAGEVTHGTTVNKQSSVLSSAIAEKIQRSDVRTPRQIPDPGLLPGLPMSLFPGQPIIPPSYPQDLAALLERHGLSKYLAVFEDQDVDLAVFLSLTDNDLKEIGIKLFGPRKKMTNAIARWHSSAPLSSTGLERSYADRLEGEMQEMAIQLNQAYNNMEKVKAQLDQERQLRSVTEGCLLEQQEVWQNIHQVATETRKRCDTMKEKIKKVRLCISDLKEGTVKNHSTETTNKVNLPSTHPGPEDNLSANCAIDLSFTRLDKYLAELTSSVQFAAMSCDRISDKCVTSGDHEHGFT